jgi:hypothetical protein
MPHINLFFFVLSASKNINVSMAMLQFFALLKQKITKVSNTAFCKPIGITISNSGATFPLTSDFDQGYIQAGQGFFVRALDNITRTFDITEAMQTHQPDAVMKSGEKDWPGIQLMAKTEEKQSSTIIAFNSEMTEGLDVSYDAGMFKANTEIELYSRLVEDNGVDFAIQCLPDTDLESLSIPLGIDVTNETMCEFRLVMVKIA